VRIYNAGLKCAARGSLEIQDAQKSPFWHHRTTLSGYIFGTKACIDNRKKTNSNTSSTCFDNMVNFGLLTVDICWRVWGTSANFNGFRVLAALLHGTLVVGVSQTAALNRGLHLYPAGRPSRWALAHISSWILLYSLLYDESKKSNTWNSVFHRRKCCQFSSTDASLSQRASTFVYNTLIVTQSVAVHGAQRREVREWYLGLVRHGTWPPFGNSEQAINTKN